MDVKHEHTRRIVALCALVFFHISSFTIIASFTKSHFLTAVQASPLFEEVVNQRPYFFLYGVTGLCFVLFYLGYNAMGTRSSFEVRIRRDMILVMGVSAFLYLAAVFAPRIQAEFLPAALYFVVYDILDDLMLVQTWTLINHAVNIRESKRIQNLFLLSGGVAAFFAGRYGVGLLQQVDGRHLYLLVGAGCTAICYGIVAYIFTVHRPHILASPSGEPARFRNLWPTQRTYRVIRSIILITVSVGLLNLFFKVLFDTQVNVHYPLSVAESAVGSTGPVREGSDPKAAFIGNYKAVISLCQVGFQFLFIYFFPRLWLNGRILYAYPLLLIPNLLVMLGLGAATPGAGGRWLFWATITACGFNDLIRRVVFDAAYQLLMFSIPERLCNSLRLYSRLLIRPLVVISVCALFVVLPAQQDPVVIYCVLVLLVLTGIIFLVWRIPSEYVLSLKHSVQRRIPVERSREAAISLEAGYIREQYRQVVTEKRDPFSDLYLLGLIRKNYTPELAPVLSGLLKFGTSPARMEALQVIRDLGLDSFCDTVETLFVGAPDPELRKAALETLARLGKTAPEKVRAWLAAPDPGPEFRRYLLQLAYATGVTELKEQCLAELAAWLDAESPALYLAGIRLVGDLGLTAFRDAVKRHFGSGHESAQGVILAAAAQLNDLDLLAAYLDRVGPGGIHDFDALGETLKQFGNPALPLVQDLIHGCAYGESVWPVRKCISALQHIHSQEALNFLIRIFANTSIPVVRREALNSIGKLWGSARNLELQGLFDLLPREIEQCRAFCRACAAVQARPEGSLLLVELARQIEHRIWALFKVMALRHPDIPVFDTYYRIRRTSMRRLGTAHVGARSLEYLHSSMDKSYDSLLEILEAVIFEDGFIAEVRPLPGPRLTREDVLEWMASQENYWLKISALLDSPAGMRRGRGVPKEELEHMIPLLEKIHFLRKVPLFKGFSVEEMVMVAQIAHETVLGTAEVVFEMGDPGDALYLILEGRVDILDERGRRLIRLGPPQSFGEIAVIDNAGRSATAVCINNCRFLRISSSDFEEILDAYPALYKNIVDILVTWLREERPGSR